VSGSNHISSGNDRAMEDERSGYFGDMWRGRHETISGSSGAHSRRIVMSITQNVNESSMDEAAL